MDDHTDNYAVITVPTLTLAQAKRVFWINIIHILLVLALVPFIIVYPVLQILRLRDGLANPNIAIMIVGGLFWLVVIMWFISWLVRRSVRRRLLNPTRLQALRVWLKNTYDLDFTEAQLLKLADVDIITGLAYQSDVVDLWQTGTTGRGVMQQVYLLKVEGRELMLFDKDTATEHESVRSRQLATFFRRFWRSVEAHEDAVYALQSNLDHGYYGVERAGRQVALFWSDPTSAQLYLPNDDYSVRQLFMPAWRNYVLESLQEDGVRCGLDFGEQEQIFDPAFVQELIQ